MRPSTFLPAGIVAARAFLGMALAAPLQDASGASNTNDIILVKRQASQQSYPEPLSDPFYVVPSNISSYREGNIVRSRPVDPWVSTPFTKSYQVLYRTNDAQGNASGTVATIWAPLIANQGPAKIFSYQYAEDAINLNCATSWVWANRRYYVVSADFEGPSSAYIAGHVEGPAVLDGIRATMVHQKLSAADTLAALYGYSGGSHSTIWASTLAASYAPEIRVAGAAFGGVPVDPLSSLLYANKGPTSLFVGGGMFGLGNGYPELNKTIDTLLTARGRTVSQDLRDPSTCLVGGPAMTKYANFDFLSIFQGPDILQNRVVTQVLARESLLSNASDSEVPVPTHPRYIYHGTNDTILPYQPVAAYVQQQCTKKEAKANIQFVKFFGGNHLDVAATGIVGALRFVKQSFDGMTPTVQCGTAAPAIIPGTYAAADLLGTVLEGVVEGVIKSLALRVPVPM